MLPDEIGEHCHVWTPIYSQNRRLWVRLHEKSGKQHTMPAQHNLEQYLYDYMEAGGIAGDPKGPLFRTVRSFPPTPLSIEAMGAPWTIPMGH